MKYLRLFEDFDSYDPYELMIIPPNKKGEMIIDEIRKPEPNLNLVRDLIALGANLEWKNEENYNWTPLLWAAMKGHLEIARMLIDAGADVNNRNGETPLYMAVSNGKLDIARMLIDAGANVNVQDEVGYTPLHWAAVFGQVEIARMLIDAGGNKDIQNNKGRAPYDLAMFAELKNLLKP